MYLAKRYEEAVNKAFNLFRQVTPDFCYTDFDGFFAWIERDTGICVDWGIYRMEEIYADDAKEITFFIYFEDRSVAFLKLIGSGYDACFEYFSVPPSPQPTFADKFIAEYSSMEKPVGIPHTSFLEKLAARHCGRNTHYSAIETYDYYAFKRCFNEDVAMWLYVFNDGSSAMVEDDMAECRSSVHACIC